MCGPSALIVCWALNLTIDSAILERAKPCPTAGILENIKISIEASIVDDRKKACLITLIYSMRELPAPSAPQKLSQKQRVVRATSLCRCLTGNISIMENSSLGEEKSAETHLRPGATISGSPVLLGRNCSTQLRENEALKTPAHRAISFLGVFLSLGSNLRALHVVASCAFCSKFV